ncbi:hypothetical protein [Algoriphagus boritolerans]
MTGESQHHWEHQIPKTKKNPGTAGKPDF